MLLCKRPASGMLGGLWELPGGAIRDGESDAEALRRILAEDTGLMVEAGEGLGEVEHVFSHFRMTLVLYGISSAKGRATARGVDAVAWVVPDAEGLADHPMPTADRRVLARAPAVDGVQLSQPAESGR
jgi:A/G-specific adenine glycosylase